MNYGNFSYLRHVVKKKNLTFCAISLTVLQCTMTDIMKDATIS